LGFTVDSFHALNSRKFRCTRKLYNFKRTSSPRYLLFFFFNLLKFWSQHKGRGVNILTPRCFFALLLRFSYKKKSVKRADFFIYSLLIIFIFILLRVSFFARVVMFLDLASGLAQYYYMQQNSRKYFFGAYAIFGSIQLPSCFLSQIRYT